MATLAASGRQRERKLVAHDRDDRADEDEGQDAPLDPFGERLKDMDVDFPMDYLHPWGPLIQSRRKFTEFLMEHPELLGIDPPGPDAVNRLEGE
jgi:hypothetical protein